MDETTTEKDAIPALTKEELLEAKRLIACYVGDETTPMTIVYWLKFIRDLVFTPHFDMNYPGPKRHFDYAVDGIRSNLLQIKNIGQHCCEYYGSMWELPQEISSAPHAESIARLDNRRAYEEVWNRYERAIVEIEKVTSGIDAKLKAVAE